MSRRGGVNIKKRITLAAVVTGCVLASLTFLFVQAVRTQLWNQSINTMLESTRQGCTTLRVQLKEAYESMGAVSVAISGYSVDQTEELEAILNNPARTDRTVSLYLPDKTSIPAGVQCDEGVQKKLWSDETDKGIIDPHISSVTGVNVFDLYLKTVMNDGTEGYLVKEYEVERIVDSFTLSFYNNAGFSYVVNAGGDVLIRPPHPGSNKTVRNLFDMLPAGQNDPEQLEMFRQSLKENGTGWAVFTYQGEKTVFCFTPLKLQSDWHLISIVPMDTVNAQTNEILIQTMALVTSILLGIALLAGLYLRYANRTNRRLKNQASYIGHLYNAVPEGIALITVQKPHRLIQLNREGRRLLEDPDSATNDAPGGRSLQEVIHPDDYERIAKLCEDTSMGGGKHSFEHRMNRKDGALLWVSGIIEKTMDENGDPVLITTFHDVTDEKLAKEEKERELLQERLTLVGAISNAYPVIIRLNLTKDTLNFIHVKPGLMADLGLQESYSQLFHDFAGTIHPDSREEYESHFSPDVLLDQLGQKKSEIFLEAKQMLLDGTYHWTSTQIIYVDNPYSDDKLAILISRRIDEQRYAQEQQRLALQSALDSARAASSAKSRFLSNMSHDIRTPMNAIVGMAAIASAHLDDRERVKACMNKISLSSKHLLSLINDVLDMSKIESGKLSLREEPFNFAELTADCVELVRSQALAGQLDLEIRLSALKYEHVAGDALRIRQVCINILSNAIKYTLPGGHILVEVWQEEKPGKRYRNFMFRCTDTGVGMSSEFLEHIFQPFERVQDSTISKIAGTGLGMTITKNIMDMMNGNIQVESQPGKGSVFTLTFPLVPQDIPEEEVPGEWIGVNSLIVDDDKQTCENAAELLLDMGLRAKFVTDGAAGVRCVAEAHGTADPFELVIIDWKMPDMDGVETARRIRETVGEDIPVIILTAYDWAEIENEAREAGVTAFISKPFYRSKLCYLLRELNGEERPSQYSRAGARFQVEGRRILLVEDNEINREIASTLIGEMGVLVEEAFDGSEAVEKVSCSGEGYYDMILMDVQMPVMDGYEATRRIRRLDREDVKHIPVIAMTANAFEEDIRAALQAGMDAHFSKPIDVDRLNDLFYKYLS